MCSGTICQWVNTTAKGITQSIKDALKSALIQIGKLCHEAPPQLPQIEVEEKEAKTPRRRKAKASWKLPSVAVEEKEVVESSETAATQTVLPEKSLAALRKITFKYRNSEAKEVKLAGDFNDWKSQTMTKKGKQDWLVTLQLSPGKYNYKFIVDGSWTKDPRNAKSQTDNYGSEHSIIEVK